MATLCIEVNIMSFLRASFEWLQIVSPFLVEGIAWATDFDATMQMRSYSSTYQTKLPLFGV